MCMVLFEGLNLKKHGIKIFIVKKIIISLYM